MNLIYRNPPNITESMLGDTTMLVSFISGAGNLLTESPNYYVTALFAGTYAIGAATKFFASYQITSNNDLESRTEKDKFTLK